MHSNLPHEILKKAYGVSYALLRVAFSVKESNANFAKELESGGVDLLSAVLTERHDDSRIALGTIQYFVRLAGDAGVTHSANSSAILEEISSLDSAIIRQLQVVDEANSAMDDKLPDLKIRETLAELDGYEFQHVASLLKNDLAKDRQELIDIDNFKLATSAGDIPVNGLKEKSENKAIRNVAIKEESINGTNENDGTKGIVHKLKRHPAIVDRIKENGNCRISEIQEVLPDVSERTLRYDLQQLTKDGVIKRVGNGGPATYYKLVGSKT